ncbi:MAG: hypothetical protein U9O83_01875 [Campylobacterota bacterium]|nr:hypothetical protein [Campylobacterota bacterium]
MKTKVQLLIDDNFIEEFMNSLPKDKVRVIEADFQVNQDKLQKVLQEYKDSRDSFIPYFKSMKNISAWFTAKRN